MVQETEKTTSPRFHEFADFRLYLQNELIRRTRLNSRYSLRAFAKFLGVQPGFLSKILLEQRSITATTVNRFGMRLGLNPAEIDELLKQIKNKKTSKKLQKKLPNNDYKNLVLDHFQIVSDWYHFAILQLTTIDHFRPSSKWIARTLGITVTEVNAAVERLQRLELLEIDQDGKWLVRDGLNTTTLSHGFSVAAFRKLQKQILEMAISSLENTPIECRDQTAMTMAIDSSLLPEAKEITKKFRRSLSQFLESGKKKDSVYHLSVSLYPVTKQFNEGIENAKQ